MSLSFGVSDQNFEEFQISVACYMLLQLNLQMQQQSDIYIDDIFGQFIETCVCLISSSVSHYRVTL
jgi:hypothetical protein